MSQSLTFELDMPPSTNALYGRDKWGGVRLKDPAKQYLAYVKRTVVDNLHRIGDFPVDKEQTYGLEITLYFDKLQNPGWFETYSKGKSKGKRKAASRYKRVDYDNRIKFLQDCLVKALGIPGDEQIFEGSQVKLEGPERVVVVIYTTDPGEYVEDKCQ